MCDLTFLEVHTYTDNLDAAVTDQVGSTKFEVILEKVEEMVIFESSREHFANMKKALAVYLGWLETCDIDSLKCAVQYPFEKIHLAYYDQ